MAPGACGCWLANQWESTFGTSSRQMILLSAHLGCCQTRSLSIQFLSERANPPWAEVCAHTPPRHFPKPSQSYWHLGRLSPSYPPACSTSTLQDQRAPGSQHYHPHECLKWSGGTRSGRDTGAVRRVCATCGDCLNAFHPWHIGF